MIIALRLLQDILFVWFMGLHTRIWWRARKIARLLVEQRGLSQDGARYRRKVTRMVGRRLAKEAHDVVDATLGFATMLLANVNNLLAHSPLWWRTLMALGLLAYGSDFVKWWRGRRKRRKPTGKLVGYKTRAILEKMGVVPAAQPLLTR